MVPTAPRSAMPALSRCPDLARGRAQPRSDPGGAAPGAAGARHGAGDRERHRRACGAISRPQLPHLIWQPTDIDPEALASIAAHRAAAQRAEPAARRSRSMSPRRPGRSTRADAVVSINMIHIAPWTAAQGLMAGAGRLLAPGARALSLRAVQGERRSTPRRATPRSTQASRRAIRHWGVRDLGDVARLSPTARLRFRRARRHAGQQSEPRLPARARDSKDTA